MTTIVVPELADVGVTLVQVVHAHPRWRCCWVIFGLHIPEHHWSFHLKAISTDIKWIYRDPHTCCSPSPPPRTPTVWLKWEVCYGLEFMPPGKWCWGKNEKRQLTDAANAKYSNDMMRKNVKKPLTGKMRKKGENLQTQQTPKPEAQEPEATPPLLLHSASVDIIIIFTPVQIKMIKYNHYIHLWSGGNYKIQLYYSPLLR